MWWNSDDYLKPSDSILQSFFSLKMQLTRSESEHGLKGNWIFLSRLWYWDNISPPISWLMTAGRLKSNGSGSGFREMTRLRIWGSKKFAASARWRVWSLGLTLQEKFDITYNTHIFTHWALVRDKNVFVIDAFLCIWLMLPTSHWSWRPCPSFWLDKTCLSPRLMAH